MLHLGSLYIQSQTFQTLRLSPECNSSSALASHSRRTLSARVLTWLLLPASHLLSDVWRLASALQARRICTTHMLGLPVVNLLSVVGCKQRQVATGWQAATCLVTIGYYTKLIVWCAHVGHWSERHPREPRRISGEANDCTKAIDA